MRLQELHADRFSREPARHPRITWTLHMSFWQEGQMQSGCRWRLILKSSHQHGRNLLKSRLLQSTDVFRPSGPHGGQRMQSIAQLCEEPEQDLDVSEFSLRRPFCGMGPPLSSLDTEQLERSSGGQAGKCLVFVNSFRIATVLFAVEITYDVSRI
jgi:hypothetical protein